jgi:hypothetical protein
MQFLKILCQTLGLRVLQETKTHGKSILPVPLCGWTKKDIPRMTRLGVGRADKQKGEV